MTGKKETTLRNGTGNLCIVERKVDSAEARVAITQQVSLQYLSLSFS